MNCEREETESYRQELGEDSEFEPIEQAQDEAAVAPLREGLIVPPRQQEPTPADEDRRTAEGRPTRRSET